MLNFIKLGLYFSLIGESRLDPMVFELINEERRRRESAQSDETPIEQHETEDTGEDIRKAA